jgi:aldose 1-epimerase
MVLCLVISMGAMMTQAAAVSAGKDDIQKSDFGKTADGTAVDLYTLTNTNGMAAKIMTYGGIITQLRTPDRAGKMGDVVLGFSDLDGYLKGSPYFGALIGRVGNRIAKGKFTLDGKEYTLAVNNGPNALHGGIKGFDKVVWTASPSLTPDGPALKLDYTSPDGEEGYPGTLKCTVVYTVTHENELKIDYSATTDKPTPINLTNHSYFNLAGSGDIFGHVLYLRARRYTPVDDTLIPTGKILPVKGTPMDFTTPHPIGDRLIEVGGDPVGYDHNYVLNSGGREFALAARVCEPTSGRIMEVYTDQPGVQFYTGNFLDWTLAGKGGWLYGKHEAFCLETQHFPDSVNHPNFPSTILRPGHTYHTVTCYKFSAK